MMINDATILLSLVVVEKFGVIHSLSSASITFSSRSLPIYLCKPAKVNSIAGTSRAYLQLLLPVMSDKFAVLLLSMSSHVAAKLC